MGAPWAGQNTNEAAKTMLQADLDERLALARGMERQAAGDALRTLRIEPMVRYIRYITGGKAFLGRRFRRQFRGHDLVRRSPMRRPAT